MIGSIKKMFGEWWGIALMKKKSEQVVAENWDLKKSVLDYIKALLIAFFLSILFLPIFLVFLDLIAFVIGNLSLSHGIMFVLAYLISIFFLVIPILLFLSVVCIVIFVCLSFLINSFFHLIALALGGKAKFSQTVSSLFRVHSALAGSFGIFLILLFLTFLVLTVAVIVGGAMASGQADRLPDFMIELFNLWRLFGLTVYLLCLLYLIYGLVLTALVLKAVHGISKFKVALAMLLIVILTVFLFNAVNPIWTVITWLLWNY